MLRKTVLALSLILGVCTGAQLLVIDSVAVAKEKKEEPKKQGVSAKVAKPLKGAQEALQKEQWDEALVKIREAQAIPERTPYDDYQINEFLFFASARKADFVTAAAALEQVVNSGFVSEEDKVERTRQVATLNFQNKNYGKAVEYGNRWIELTGGSAPQAYELTGQAQYLLEDNAAAIQTLRKAVDVAKAAGQPVKEQWLQVMLSAYDRTDDAAGVSNTLEELVQVDVKRPEDRKKYWEQLLDTVYAKQENDDRTTLEIHRLRNELGILRRADDYGEMADIAASIGIPGEAVKALEKATTVEGSERDRPRRLARLAELRKLAETDRKSLPGLEKEAPAAKTGETYYALGVGYLSFDQYEPAAVALKQGMQKGGLKRPDEAQITLGRTLLKLNQKEEARQAFAAVPQSSKLARIARLWAIYANQA